jgi:hypothetical protein
MGFMDFCAVKNRSELDKRSSLVKKCHRKLAEVHDNTKVFRYVA